MRVQSNGTLSATVNHGPETGESLVRKSAIVVLID